MNRMYPWAFALGLAILAWIAAGFARSSLPALLATAAIAAFYLLGFFELRQFRAATAGLLQQLERTTEPPAALPEWLQDVPPPLRTAVRLRIEGERAALPGPALAPYLVGLLVMLGMLGTFLGMIVTFRGAVFALEGSGDLQALRAALAQPLQGLGLSFGTSVAGVAASAMLGLMLAIARRERAEAGRQLDMRIAGVLQPFSLAHRRQASFEALRAQAHALPEAMGKLEAVMERIERRSEQLDAQLLERHAGLQRELARSYSELSERVGAALGESATASGNAAADAVRLAVEGTMGRFAADTQVLQQRLAAIAAQQVESLSARFESAARSVADTWAGALAGHEASSHALMARLQGHLDAFGTGFQQRGSELVDAVQASLTREQARQAQAERERLQAWTASLSALGAELQAQWRTLGEQAAAQQHAAAAALDRAVATVAERAATQATQSLERADALVERSETLLRERAAAEARWTADQQRRMDQTTALWRSGLQDLRTQEEQRAGAAVARLGELQAAVAQHLATLGAALEAPLTRLLQTASEVPQAAASVIAQLREEMTRVAQREDTALQEREQLLERLHALLAAVDDGARQQRQATEALVASAGSVLEQAGARFAGAMEAQAARAGESATHVAASALEVASLAEAFGEGIARFQAGNDKLVEGLERMEASLRRATERSNEQLAYYVAQAREVIDLSVASQQDLVESLRQLRARPTPVPSPAPAPAPALVPAEGAAG